MTISFTKLQGAGNDFVLIDGGAEPSHWPRLARAICDRHFGVGGDGLLVVLPSPAAELGMRIFNPDGSEADACGNGLRCLVRYALEKGLVTGGSREITIETMSGVRQAWLKASGERPLIRVGMGEPRFRAEDIPVVIAPAEGAGAAGPITGYPLTVEGQALTLDIVSMGNPHTVYFTEGPVADFPLSRLGPEVERHQIFPQRTNFEVARVLRPGLIEARVWERGVGETLACGSGACAIATFARLHGSAGDNVDIILPGGTLGVEWAGTGEVYLNGPAEIVFSGEYQDEAIKKD